ncbi:hypothetical protein I302_105619 [Kwoniella bestiolae CBS 10118]|uniref:Uncharacterized protein n=1 Tax=Kwoniella bestiolae CBS 10118 TaxID=1296100 RepID=A0A1B9G1Q2_9TREE|nr:hypothetical protein I302_04738 [Kwoniella bestiolae CBS 10118]OCF24928.1 hypothetical protein I302_04738 [Kwoniella bestiolae CBS 10118]
MTTETLSSDLSNEDLIALARQDDTTISHRLYYSSKTFHKHVYGQQGLEAIGRQIVQRCLHQIETAKKKKKQYGKRSEGGGSNGARPLFGNSSYHTQFSPNTLSSEQRALQQGRFEVSEDSRSIPLPAQAHAQWHTQSQSQSHAPAYAQAHAQWQAESGNNPFGVGSSGIGASATATPQAQGVIPLSQYDSNFTLMTFKTIRPLGKYTETWKSCDHETQQWLEHLSLKLSKFDHPTLCSFAADEKVFRQAPLSSIIDERSVIYRDFYSGKPEGVELMRQILSRAIELRVLEDRARAYSQLTQDAGRGSGGGGDTARPGFDPIRDI